MLHNKYSHDQKTGLSNTGIIRKPDVFDVQFSNSRTIRKLDVFCPVFECHLKTGRVGIRKPDILMFENRTISCTFEHSKTRHVHYSDPHCTLIIWILDLWNLKICTQMLMMSSIQMGRLIMWLRGPKNLWFLFHYSDAIWILDQKCSN